MQNPSNTSSPTPTQAFAPLPLRALGVLEIVDTAIKLLRRYFLVLIAWSAVVVLGSNSMTFLTMGLSSFSGSSTDPTQMAGNVILTSLLGMILAFFLWPLITGAVTCSIAAAVRGQTITFAQCWNFTKPRYGKILGTYFLCILTAVAVGFAYSMALILILVAGAFTLQGAQSTFTLVLAVVGVVLFYVSLLFFGLGLATWMLLSPIVACLENDPRTSPLRRAWDLLRGNWRRAINLALLFGLIQFVIALILLMMSASAAGAMSRGGGAQAFLMAWGQAAGSAVYMLLSTSISLLTTPLMLLLVAVLYLDLRTRKEALDLEWTAHVTADQSNVPQTAPRYGDRWASEPPVAAATPFAPTSAPPPPPDAPPISPETQAAWTGSAPDVSTNSQPVTNTQILANDATTTVASTQVTPPVSSDAPINNVPINDAPINVWETEMAPTAPVNSAPVTATQEPFQPAPSIQTTPPAFDLQTPTPVPQPNFTQLLPDSDNQSEDVSTQATGPKTCAQCGATAQAHQSFCMQCGARLPVSA